MQTVVYAGPYAPKLNEYLRLRRRYWRCILTFVAIFMSGLIGGVLLDALVAPPQGIRTPFILVVVLAGAVAWVAMIWTSVRVTRWPCPRCGRRFARPKWPGNRCHHCDLSIDAD